MEGRGGCCIARYAGGAYDMSKLDRIMLRFRPIAPKPASTAGSVSGGSSPEISEVVSPRSGRGRRRYNNATNSNKRCNNKADAGANNNNNNNNNRKRKSAIVGEEIKGDAVVVTLPLLPEIPDRKDTKRPPVISLPAEQVESLPTWLVSGRNAEDRDHRQVEADRTAVMMPQVVGSFVTVECVTVTWGVDIDGIGCTDEERRGNLERDTCPGLISDELGKVTWTNEAYRKMVAGRGGAEAEMAVWLVMKDKLPVTGAFTCKMRVQNQNNTYGNGKERSSITVPCDAWRMDGGGFAWRLDVKAALCLGR